MRENLVKINNTIKNNVNYKNNTVIGANTYTINTDNYNKCLELLQLVKNDEKINL